ncbi:sensor histidine kinase [Oceanibaculum pacificum]|nr:ATP-binding protein [Oceanibaculum pacificum]
MRGLFFLTGLLLAGMLFGAAGAVARSYSVGPDLPYDLYEDPTGRMTLEDFLALPAEELRRENRVLSRGYTDSAFWLRFTIPRERFEDDALWMQLSPVYLDLLTLYSRPLDGAAPWRRREAGDRWGAPDDDLNYRFPVYTFSQPAPASEGYDIVLRVQSTSAVILFPMLWQPAAFLGQAAWATSFWSFYFGMAAFSSALAILLALYLNSRVLWSIGSVSAVYLGIACIQGYVTWLFGDIWGPLQHYLTSIMTLVTYSTIFWMSAEVLNIREHSPRLYRGVMAAIGLSLLLQLSIPLGFYEFAKDMQIVICVVIAGMAVQAILRLYRLGRMRSMDAAIVTLPAVFSVTGLLHELMLRGLIGFSPMLFGQWQFVMMAIMLTVMILIVRRISQERQLERELRVEREASFNQRQFVAMVSHEFRTPLAVISAALENLRPGLADREQVLKRYDKIQRATDRLSQLTDNCLADARLSADTLYLDMQPVDLVEQVRAAAQLVEMSDLHRLHLTVGGLPDTGAPVIVQADPALLRIALSNLLDNAVKYSEHGRIDVGIVRRDERYVVSIQDQGRGIPRGQAGLIFERYRQGESQGRRRQRGSGLGLFVARQIALAHGGDIILAANTPAGCRFEVFLPATPPATDS